MSSPAIQFKGSGFYITDYPKGEKGSAPKSDGGKSDKDAKADKPQSAEAVSSWLSVLDKYAPAKKQ